MSPEFETFDRRLRLPSERIDDIVERLREKLLQVDREDVRDQLLGQIEQILKQRG
jgi:hypothetical protein